MITGCIHGRFQPFHNGHLEYLVGAKRLSGFVTIGITNYEPALLDENSPTQRLEENNNPFTYRERVGIIRAAINANFEDPSTFEITPFPIHRVEIISNYVAADTIMYTTIYEDWNRTKLKLLTDAGYKVIVLWERDHKEFTGAAVRAAIVDDRVALRKMLPQGALQEVERLMEVRANS